MTKMKRTNVAKRRRSQQREKELAVRPAEINICTPGENGKNLEEIYASAVRSMKITQSADVFRNLANQFETIAGYKDAAQLAERCRELASESAKTEIYRRAKNAMMTQTIASYDFAIEQFEQLGDWKDAAEQLAVCRDTVEKLKAQEEQKKLREIRQKAEEEQNKIYWKKKRRKYWQIAGGTVAAILLGVLVWGKLLELLQERLQIAREAKDYAEGVAALENGDILRAYSFLSEAGDYADSASLRDGIRYEYEKLGLGSVRYGDCIVFGTYEQDNNPDNGKEDIRWIVLDKDEDNNQLFVLSLQALECKPYDSQTASGGSITWAECELRTWLNETFYEAAFSEQEKAHIRTTKVVMDAYEGDKLFLLSYSEIQECYFERSPYFKCVPTDSATTMIHTNYCNWWLRTPGERADTALYGEADWSNVSRFGAFVGNTRIGVRPAMWIEIPE